MPKILSKIIKVLITSDFFLNLGWGLLSPIFALFVLENITLNNPAKAAEVAGFSALFYWIAKSFMEIPIGRFLDKHDGEKDDFWFMFFGLLIVGFVPIGYLFSKNALQIYLLQIIHATGMAMAIPSWLAIFTRHIDKGREAFEWSLESTSISIGAGIAGGAGGIMASVFGFKILFITVSALTIISALLYLLIRNSVFIKRDPSEPAMEKPVVEP